MRDRKASLRVFRLCFSNPVTVANVYCFMAILYRYLSENSIMT
jgi:hypothetical protein